MLTLATSNPAKYAPFGAMLERLRIALEPPPEPLPEIQTLSFAEALETKARAAARAFGRPVLVDDAGVVLDAYKPFPGPITSLVLPSLGRPGLERLINGLSGAATMQCHLGCWSGDRLRSWTGTVHGKIDVTRQIRDERMPLSDLFVPEEAETGGTHLHRRRALEALAEDVFDLHLETVPAADGNGSLGWVASAHQCPFCIELEQGAGSIFSELMGQRLSSRTIYEDDHFVLMPPLGEFIEGGLLLLTRAHILSFAHLPPELFQHLEALLAAIGAALNSKWGVAPLVFEHGPAPCRGKGVCCVDHAHLNIFPAAVRLRPQLSDRMSLKLGALSEVRRLRTAEFGYLLVQENDGARWVYDAQNVPTQLVRRIITNNLGIPERWHWRDYPGFEELAATYQALKGKLRL